jgi:ArsR family transcriptional regulator
MHVSTITMDGLGFGAGRREAEPAEQPLDVTGMEATAQDATNLLKALSHEGRLLILCHLTTGEKSVTEFERLLDASQAAVSQQLARLRLEGLVNFRREGKAIYYSLADPKVRRILDVLHELYCETKT